MAPPKMSDTAGLTGQDPTAAWERWWGEIDGTPGEIVWDADSRDLEADLGHFADSFGRALPVVDFGCGDGRQTRFLARHFPTVLGVDLSPAAIAQARAADNPPNVGYRVLDARDTAGAARCQTPPTPGPGWCRSHREGRPPSPSPGPPRPRSKPNGRGTWASRARASCGAPSPASARSPTPTGDLAGAGGSPIRPDRPETRSPTVSGRRTGQDVEWARHALRTRIRGRPGTWRSPQAHADTRWQPNADPPMHACPVGRCGHRCRTERS